MPVSMAIAGSVGEVIGLPLTFFIAGAVPVVLAVIAIVAARLPADEIAHPLDGDPDDVPGGEPYVRADDYGSATTPNVVSDTKRGISTEE